MPLGLALHGATALPSLGYSFLFGFLIWLVVAEGLGTGFVLYVGMDSPAVVAYVVGYCAYHAIPYGLFGWLHGAWRWGTGTGAALHKAAAFTVVLYLFPAPLPVFPVHSLYTYPYLIQLLDIGGVPLLLFCFALFNVLLVDLVLRARARKLPLGVVSSLALLCAVVMAYGHIRLQESARDALGSGAGQHIRVAVIQPNIPIPAPSGFDTAEREAYLRELVDMSDRAMAQNPELTLTIWPEAPIDFDLNEQSKDRSLFEEHSRDHEIPLLVNGVQTQAGQAGRYNTCHLLHGGESVAAYQKQKLFPFAEYLPGEARFPFLRSLFPGASDCLPGTEAAIFELDGRAHVIPAICYEVLFPEHIGDFVELGGDVIVNVTNDAWFGHTLIPEFQIAAAVFRAVEYRVPLIRSSNSGNGILVRASGEIEPGSRTAVFEKLTAVYKVFIPGQRSIFARLGNLFLYLVVLTLALDLYWIRLRRFAARRP